MRTIELCIDARMAFSSGIGTCIRQLTPYLAEPPFKVKLLVGRPLNGQESVWCKGLEQIIFPASIYSLKEQVLYRNKIPSCDLFWSPHYNVPLLPIRAKKRVVTIHDACHLALSQLLSFPEKIYAKFVMGRALHGSDAVITDSFFSQKELIRFLGLPQKDLQVIPPAVDRNRFRRITEESVLKTIRQKYDLPKKFLLFVGNLKPHKNLSGLVKAFETLSLGNEWGLVIVGKRTGLRNGEKREILGIENVPDADLPALYSLAELFVFPSFYEGFGLPPLEAMSCGCPAIVSNAASLPEVCGEAALYVNPDDPSSIAKAIQEMASNENLRNNWIQKGLERVQAFDWEDTARRYRKLFEEIQDA